jgi:phosphatidylglycerophosphate synthase
VDRFDLLTPALVLLGGFVLAFAVYCGLYVTGRRPSLRAVKHNQLFGPFLAGFLVWLLRPVERALVGRVSPNTITLVSVLLCAGTGVAIALGQLPRAVWFYLFAGIFDVLDGRVARHAGKPQAKGALFDSVSDRWGEWFVFTGYAWLMRDTVWLLAVMSAVGGSMMVSYTRARAEGLGLALSSGLMQRAERIVLVAVGTMVAAWVGADDATLVAPILGVTMLVTGLLSSATALNRWIAAHRALVVRDVELVAVKTRPAPVAPAAPVGARVQVAKSQARTAT